MRQTRMGATDGATAVEGGNPVEGMAGAAAVRPPPSKAATPPGGSSVRGSGEVLKEEKGGSFKKSEMSWSESSWYERSVDASRPCIFITTLSVLMAKEIDWLKKGSTTLLFVLRKRCSCIYFLHFTL